MTENRMRRMVWAALLAMVAGCHAYSLDIDGRIVARAEEPVDVLPPLVPRELPSSLPEQARLSPPTDPNLILASGELPKVPDDKDKKITTMMERLKFKQEILGIQINDPEFPPRTKKKEFDAAVQKFFPPLPTLLKLPDESLGPNDRPMTQADLQQIALSTSPKIRQAHLDVDAARGAAIQAGLHPNPTIGYDGGAIGQGNQDGVRSAGQQGAFVEQTIVTMGKKTIARESARREILIAEQRLRQAESDLQAQVRTGYFALLSARENYRVTRGLAELTDELFSILLSQFREGFAAAYEPMQIRVLSMQSRQTLVLAHNRYLSTWRQLAANLGVPDMPLTKVEGRIDMAVPHYEYEKVLAHVLSRHSDMVAAHFDVEKHQIGRASGR